MCSRSLSSSITSAWVKGVVGVKTDGHTSRPVIGPDLSSLRSSIEVPPSSTDFVTTSGSSTAGTESVSLSPSSFSSLLSSSSSFCLSGLLSILSLDREGGNSISNRSSHSSHYLHLQFVLLILLFHFFFLVPLLHLRMEKGRGVVFGNQPPILVRSRRNKYRLKIFMQNGSTSRLNYKQSIQLLN